MPFLLLPNYKHYNAATTAQHVGGLYSGGVDVGYVDSRARYLDERTGEVLYVPINPQPNLGTGKNQEKEREDTTLEMESKEGIKPLLSIAFKAVQEARRPTLQKSADRDYALPKMPVLSKITTGKYILPNYTSRLIKGEDVVLPVGPTALDNAPIVMRDVEYLDTDTDEDFGVFLYFKRKNKKGLLLL